MFPLGYWLNYDISSYCSYKNDINFVLLYKDLQNILLKSRFILTTYSMLPSVSVQFSHSVMSNSLRPHRLQHTRPPCPSPTPRVYRSPCPSSRWYPPTISSSVVPFSSCFQSFPASGSLQMSQFFTSRGQSIGVSASASMNEGRKFQSFQKIFRIDFLLGWTGWISLQSKGLSRVFFNTTVQKQQFLALSFLYSPTLTYINDYW